MTVSITKRAERKDQFRRDIFPFSNARSGFGALLRALGLTNTGRVLLPSYIGYSPNEGSGVFDPVRQCGVGYDFYRMTANLQIDLSDLEQKLKRPTDLVVFIHYFGYPDRQLVEASALVRNANALILEDAAHALYSDWVTGLTGHIGDASLFSLHKMLPVLGGGLLQVNPSIAERVRPRLEADETKTPLSYSINEFDLPSITAHRRNAAKLLQRLVTPLTGIVDALFSDLPERVVPQTYPVLISRRSRDELYFEMNRAGFGAVSLYHTLIEEIPQASFPRIAHARSHHF